MCDDPAHDDVPAPATGAAMSCSGSHDKRPTPLPRPQAPSKIPSPGRTAGGAPCSCVHQPNACHCPSCSRRRPPPPSSPAHPPHTLAHGPHLKCVVAEVRARRRARPARIGRPGEGELVRAAVGGRRGAGCRRGGARRGAGLRGGLSLCRQAGHGAYGDGSSGVSDMAAAAVLIRRRMGTLGHVPAAVWV